MKDIKTQDRLIFALDVPEVEQAKSLVETLDDSVHFYKIGMEMLMTGQYFELLDWLLKKDLEKAYSWYLKSAEGAFPKAQYSLGLCLALGKGCDKNITLSKQWIKKAHENGYTFGGTF